MTYIVHHDKGIRDLIKDYFIEKGPYVEKSYMQYHGMLELEENDKIIGTLPMSSIFSSRSSFEYTNVVVPKGSTNKTLRLFKYKYHVHEEGKESISSLHFMSIEEYDTEKE